MIDCCGPSKVTDGYYCLHDKGHIGGCFGVEIAVVQMKVGELIGRGELGSLPPEHAKLFLEIANCGV